MARVLDIGEIKNNPKRRTAAEIKKSAETPSQFKARIKSERRTRVLKHLQAGKPITILNCYPILGIVDIAKMISDFRKDNHKILSAPKPHINNFGEEVVVNVYWIDIDPQEATEHETGESSRND